VARRAIALILLVAGLAFIGLFVVQTIGRIGGNEKPKPPPPVAAPPTLKIIFPEGDCNTDVTSTAAVSPSSLRPPSTTTIVPSSR
jgi:hypothetical protein